jgi:hypothetical protein
MTTLLDTIRAELREQEGALREQAEQFRKQGRPVMAAKRSDKADTLADVCDLIIARQVSERADREKLGATAL